MTTIVNTKIEREKRAIIFVTTAMAFLEVMDMTITSVSLRQMRGVLSATASQISWTISIYIMSAAIITPLSGFLVLRYGRKKILVLSLFGFLISSIICGITNSFLILLLFRGIQGAFGAPLAPIAQSIMAENFQGNDRNKAMAIFSMGIMSAPLFGPIIGGFLNDNLSWRFSFFINVPICLIILFFIKKLIKESVIRKFEIDWVGLVLLIFGIFCLQFVLEQGNFYNWYNSLLIFALTIFGISCIVLFFLFSRIENAIIPRQLFYDKNFIFSIIFGMVFSAGFFGIISILPMQLESLNGFSAQYVGCLLAPRGVASIISMLFIPKLMQKINAKILVMIGFLLFAMGTYILSKQSNISINQKQIIFATILQGISTAFFFIPLSVIAYKTLSRENISQASGVFNFSRSLGGSFGISMATMFQEKFFQQNWNYYVSYLLPNNYNLKMILYKQQLLLTQLKTFINLQNKVLLNASLMSYANTYLLFSLVFIFGFIFVGWVSFFHKI